MTTTTIKHTLRTLVAASVLLLASACSDALGPNVGSSNIDQGGQNQPAASEPGSGERDNPAMTENGLEGLSDNGAGEDQGTANLPDNDKVAA